MTASMSAGWRRHQSRKSRGSDKVTRMGEAVIAAWSCWRLALGLVFIVFTLVPAPERSHALSTKRSEQEVDARTAIKVQFHLCLTAELARRAALEWQS